jgi:hypothetical protein
MLILLSTCTKDNPPDPPANPYSGVNYNTDTTTPPGTPDPNSIVGLHKNIFFPKCAKSGCHDGTFEPDYRTVESTYATLVYQPCLKTTVDSVDFRLRAWPYKPDSSFIMRRLLTTGSDYMPSNGNRLPSSDIDHIRTWIQNGCADQNGVIHSAPDLPPYFVSTSGVGQYAAFKSISPIPSGQLDTSRVGNLFYNSFKVPQGQPFYMAFVVGDDSTAVSAFTVNQLKLSTNKDFTSGVLTVPGPFYLTGYNLWIQTVPNSYPSGTTVYFRYYINDGHHTSPSEYPTNQSYSYIKSYCSFYVQ